MDEQLKDLGIGGEQVAPSAAQLARQDARRATTWRGDPGVHNEAIIEAAINAGEKVYNDKNEYVGLTYARIIELLEEIKVHREGNGVKLMGETLTARTDELNELRHAVSKLRWWLSQNTRVEGMADKNDIETIEVARAMMETAKTAVSAAWPVLMTIWGNVAHTLQAAGIIALDRPTTGDMTLEDRVSERPR